MENHTPSENKDYKNYLSRNLKYHFKKKLVCDVTIFIQTDDNENETQSQHGNETPFGNKSQRGKAIRRGNNIQRGKIVHRGNIAHCSRNYTSHSVVTRMDIRNRRTSNKRSKIDNGASSNNVASTQSESIKPKPTTISTDCITIPEIEKTKCGTQIGENKNNTSNSASKSSTDLTSPKVKNMDNSEAATSSATASTVSKCKTGFAMDAKTIRKIKCSIDHDTNKKFETVTNIETLRKLKYTLEIGPNRIGKTALETKKNIETGIDTETNEIPVTDLDTETTKNLETAMVTKTNKTIETVTDSETSNTIEAAVDTETKKNVKTTASYENKKNKLTQAKSSVTIVYNSLECHKVILASSSEYFQRLFEENPDTSTVFMSTVDVDTAREAICFLYTGECVIKTENVKSLIELSTAWEVPLLKEECLKYMTNAINIHNADLLYELAVKLNENDMEEKFSYFIRKYFNEVYQATKFRRIGMESLYKIISHDEINIQNEDVIFKALTSLKSNLETNLMMLSKNHFDHLRFEYLSHKYLFSVVYNYPLMKNQPQRERMLECVAFKRGCKKYKHFVSQEPRGPPRYWGDRYRRIVTINESGHIIIYDEANKKWRERIKVPPWFKSSSACCIQGNNLIMLGGATITFKYNHLVASIGLSGEVNYKMLTPLKPPTSFAGICCHGDMVYVCGGFHDSSATIPDAHRLSCTTNNWHALPKMIARRCNPLVIKYSSKLYVIGGWEDEEKGFVQRYHEERKKWTKLKYLPTKCNDEEASILVYRDRITIIKSTQCLIYNDVDDTWTVQEYDDIGDVCNSFIFKDHICSCVGFDRPCFKKYDIDKNKWTVMDITVPRVYYNKFVFTF